MRKVTGKTFLTLALTFTIVSGLSACGVAIGNPSSEKSSSKESSEAGSSEKKSSDTEVSDVDFSAFPEKLSDWTAENINEYFTSAGVFTKKDWVYVQDHATYYTGTVIDEGAGYEDEEGTITIAVFSFDTKNEDAKKAMEETAAQKKLPKDLGSIELTHMLDKFAFDYNLTTDETVYQKMEDAFAQLEKHFGIKADF